MSLLGLLFRRRHQEVFDPDPGETREMPARPYKVLHADLPFYSDADCRAEVKGARLLVLRCEDPRHKHTVVECMPSRKRYSRADRSVGIEQQANLGGRLVRESGYAQERQSLGSGGRVCRESGQGLNPSGTPLRYR